MFVFWSKIRFSTRRFSRAQQCEVPRVAVLFSFYLLLDNLISSFICSCQIVEFISVRVIIFSSRTEDSQMPQKFIFFL